MNSLECRVREITCNILGVEPVGVPVDARFVEDLGADSLDCVELMIAFEDAFEIELADEVVPKLVSLGAVVRHVASLLFGDMSERQERLSAA